MFLNWRFSFYPKYCPVLSVSKWLFSLINEMCNLKTAPDKRILWNYLQSCNNKIVGFDNPVFDVCQKGELFHTGFLLKIASFLRIARAFGCWPEKCQEIKAVGLYITYSVFIYSANENKWITGIQLNFGCCNRKRFYQSRNYVYSKDILVLQHFIFKSRKHGLYEFQNINRNSIFNYKERASVTGIASTNWLKLNC